MPIADVGVPTTGTAVTVAVSCGRSPSSMPYQIDYRFGSSRATILYAGHLTGGDVADAFEDLRLRLPEALPRLSVLHDARTVKSVVAGPAEIRRMATALNALQARAPAGRAAHVGGYEHPRVVGIVRLVLALVGTSTRERRVFTDIEAALAWLDDGDA